MVRFSDSHVTGAPFFDVAVRRAITPGWEWQPDTSFKTWKGYKLVGPDGKVLVKIHSHRQRWYIVDPETGVIGGGLGPSGDSAHAAAEWFAMARERQR